MMTLHNQDGKSILASSYSPWMTADTVLSNHWSTGAYYSLQDMESRALRLLSIMGDAWTGPCSGYIFVQIAWYVTNHQSWPPSNNRCDELHASNHSGCFLAMPGPRILLARIE